MSNCLWIFLQIFVFYWAVLVRCLSNQPWVKWWDSRQLYFIWGKGNKRNLSLCLFFKLSYLSYLTRDTQYTPMKCVIASCGNKVLGKPWVMEWNFTRYGHYVHHDQSHCLKKLHAIPWSPVMLWWYESQLVCSWLCVFWRKVHISN